MSRILFRPTVVLAILVMLVTTTAATNIPASRRPERKSSIDSDVPLAILQRVDKQLTALDADNQALRLGRKRIGEVRSSSRRNRMLRQVQRSPQSRERVRTVNQLIATSSRAERTYRGRHQQYGARLFRDLYAKATALRKPMLQAQTASTSTGFDRAESMVDARLLSVVIQFQAISGGYAALACHPGTWACCRPHTIKDGNLEVRGCTWSCASKLTACSGGCLGPRIPTTVVAVKNGVPKRFANRQHHVLAVNRGVKPKSSNRPAVIASHPGIPAGSE